jgi:uncharacterized protein (TIGR03435 family)
MNRTTLTVLFAAVPFSGAAWDQIEVASIKPTPPAVDSSSSDLLPGGRFRATNRTVQWLMRAALGVPDERILGGPAWVRTDGFDIDARTGTRENMTPDLVRPLLLQLLADRFELKYHREARQLPVYRLVATKPGLKPGNLKPSRDDSQQAMSNSLVDGKMVLHSTHISMRDFAGFLSRQVRRPVLDNTGISGEFDIALDWAPDENPDSNAPSIFTSLRDQLGLRLEPAKSEVDVYVIDSIAKPSAN